MLRRPSTRKMYHRFIDTFKTSVEAFAAGHNKLQRNVLCYTINLRGYISEITYMRNFYKSNVQISDGE